jgi:fructose-1,6-bisphosphatase/inositol monophosphatase family enzyme
MLDKTEKLCIDSFRQRVDTPKLSDSEGVGDWVDIGLRLLLDAGRNIRATRPGAGRGEADYKGDGSPFTRLEQAIEEDLRLRLAAFDPIATVIGEESGGSMIDVGVAVAIDPIDGTWAFLNGTENFSTTLAFFREGEPFLGMVSNPKTGEIGYAAIEGPARLLQLSLFGEEDVAYTLPPEPPETAPILVNAHPSRRGGALLEALFDAWEGGDVQMVRSPGGSPVLALLEAAKGSFVYVNLWSKRPAEVYDLAAGTLLVRQAGGEVTDLEGRPIDSLHHQGPFVAGIDGQARAKVASITRQAMGG